MLQERKLLVETELEHTQRELRESKSYQAALQAELDMLRGLAHTSHKSQQLLSQQHEPAVQVRFVYADLSSPAATCNWVSCNAVLRACSGFRASTRANMPLACQNI